MRYADIVEFEVNNGEGVGCSLFVQGCHFHCKNCFNQETWDFNGGKEWTLEEEDKLFKIIKQPYIVRVSILGGEPLAEENISTVYEIIRKIPITKKVWIYTGRLYEELSQDLFGKLILSRCDVLVDGKFVDTLKDLSLSFRGSSNQRIIDVKKSLEEQKVCLYE